MAGTDTFPQGRYRDRLLAPDGACDHGWRSNLIVDRGRFLLAGFMRGDTAGGIQRLLIGRGDAAWDAAGPPAPARTAEALTDTAPFEITLAPGDIEYLGDAGDATAGPTNQLRLTVTLGPNEPLGEDPYPLREFGLFGTFGTEGYMINYVRHPVLFKAADATLERTIQLVF